MLDAIDHLTDILIGIAILFLVPLIYIGLKQDDLIRSVVSEQTAKIVDETRSSGYLSREMFEEFQESLSKTGLLYDINLEHKERIMEPEYRFRTIDEILEEQNKAFNGSNVYHYYPVRTNIPFVTDPIDNSGLTMNTETNASVLAKSTNTPSTGHAHTDACYEGHRHQGGNNLTFTHSHAHDYTCTRFLYMGGVDFICSSCGDFYFYAIGVYDRYGNYIGGTPLLHTTDTCTKCQGTMYVRYGVNKYTYSCGYVVDENGDSSADVIANGVTRVYPGMTSPQSVARQTYTSGCYSYHKSQPYESMITYDQWTGEITNNYTVWSSVLQGTDLCTLPAYIGARGTFSWDATMMYLCYKLSVQSNGTILWDFASCEYDGRIPNHTFPSGITISQLYGILQSLPSAFRTYTGYYNVPYSTSVFFSGSQHVCSFNHSSGTDRWVLTCGQAENYTQVCDKVIASIVPTHPVQAVFTGEALITTVKITYMDGSTKVAIANTDFSTNTPITDKTVTLSMTDAFGNTKNCTIIVTVVPRTRTCIHGHTYNLSNDGSDPGCPYCKSWLASFRIEYPTTPTFTIYRGTTLAANGVTLLATYLDGHTELLESEYIDNLDRYYVGSQNVTMSYKGHYVYLTVITKRNLKLCPICHRHYELHPDDSDPGCPWCAARTPIFTGNVLQYDRMKYTKDILEALYEGDGLYRFTDKDFFKISVKSRRGSIGTRLISAIYLNDNLDIIHVIKGGYVREDGYYYK